MKMMKNKDFWGNMPTFDDLFTREPTEWFNRFSLNTLTMPAVNIRETEQGIELEMAVPGMKKDDFQIELKDDVLTVSCEVAAERESSDDHFTRREFNFQSFSRSMRLPGDTYKAEQIKATYENGLLQLQIPMREEARHRKSKMIAVS